MAERPNDGIHDLRVGMILGGLAALVGTVAACVIVVHALATSWNAPLAGSNSVGPVSVPEPQLQSAPQLERARFFAEKESLLHRYAWLDASRGVARIPIEEAMALMARSAAPAPERAVEAR